VTSEEEEKGGQREERWGVATRVKEGRVLVKRLF
jgi:hypothetical protein